MSPNPQQNLFGLDFFLIFEMPKRFKIDGGKNKKTQVFWANFSHSSFFLQVKPFFVAFSARIRLNKVDGAFARIRFTKSTLLDFYRNISQANVRSLTLFFEAKHDFSSMKKPMHQTLRFGSN